MLTAGRFTPRVHLRDQQPLGLRNMLLVANFEIDQQARVEIMINEWLQNGEQAAVHKELQSLHGLQCIEKYRDPESPAVPLELVRFNLQNFPLDSRNWIKTNAAQLFEKSVRKGQHRCTYRTLSAILSRYLRNVQGMCAPAPAPFCKREWAAPLLDRTQAAPAQRVGGSMLCFVNADWIALHHCNFE